MTTATSSRSSSATAEGDSSSPRSSHSQTIPWNAPDGEHGSLHPIPPPTRGRVCRRRLRPQLYLRHPDQEQEHGRTVCEAAHPPPRRLRPRPPRARWGAHAARRGPVVARTVADKLAELLDDSQQADAKKAVERLLARIWSGEGAIPDLIDTGVEDGRPVDEILADVLARAEAIEADARDAVTLLHSVTAARAN